MRTEKVTIEKMVFGGQALARLEDGQVVFVWNALPGEVIEIEIPGKKNGVLQGHTKNIIQASPSRVEPKEKHYLSSSPWGMMDFQLENEWKVKMAEETYEKIGKMQLEKPLEIFCGEEEYGYRNKIELSFATKEDGTVTFAFFERGEKDKIAVEESLLSEPIINEIAGKVLEWIHGTKMTPHNLKALIVRSNGQGQGIAALFIKDKLEFKRFPKLEENFLGFQLYYSTHKCPASVPTALLYTEGQDYLIADILDTKMKFGLLSFFQINIPVFKEVLKVIQENIKDNSDVLDFYSGVGAIGLAIAKKAKSVELLDSNIEGIEYAKENIQLNNFSHVTARCAIAEKMTEMITKEKIIILDPPRAGLHQNVVNKLLEVTPEKVLYMSCNVSTHARDIELLSQKYTVEYLKLFNFFPRTPHIEALAILVRK